MFRGRTLVIAPESPWPTTNGVRTKLAGFVKILGPSVDIVSPPGDATFLPSPGASWTHINPHPNNIARARALAQRQLPITAHLPSPKILELVHRLLDAGSRYQVIHLDTLATIHLAAPLRKLMSTRGQHPVIVSSLNDSYSLLLSSGGLNDRLLPRTYCHYVKAVERRLLPHADWVDVVSEHDVAWLREVAPAASPRLIPLGIDTAAFAGPRLEPQWDILYLGTMCAPAFHWLRQAFDSVIPCVQSALGGVRVAVAGPDATPEALEYFYNHNIGHLGFVQDLSTLLRSARTLLVSSRQRAGTPTKALQAMAAGTPVVGMEALDGIPHGEDHVSYSRATDWRDLAARVLLVLSDQNQASRLAQGGRHLVERQHEWSVVHDRYFDFAGELGRGYSC